MDDVTTLRSDRAASVHGLLRLVYSVVPIVAGIDKFFNWLVDWHLYLAEPVAALLPITPQSFMLLVGVIEIVAGILTLLAPRIGGIVVALWLVGIAVNLVIGGFYDIAVRDLSMAAGAWALSRLSVPVELRGRATVGASRTPVYP